MSGVGTPTSTTAAQRGRSRLALRGRGEPDDEGNYLTLLATDSEGNAVVFSEYNNY